MKPNRIAAVILIIGFAATFVWSFGGCAGNAYFKPLSTSQAVAMVLQDAPALIKIAQGKDYLGAVALGLNSIAPQLANKQASDVATTVAKTVTDFSGGNASFANLAIDLANTIGGSKQPDADALAAAAKIDSVAK